MKIVKVFIVLGVLLISGCSSTVSCGGDGIIIPIQPASSELPSEIRGAGAILPLVIIDDSCENREVRFRNV